MSSPSELSVNDAVGTESEETRRQAMEDKLKTRDAQRLEALEAKRQARAETSAENESVGFFTRQFNSDVDAIVGDISAAAERKIDSAMFQSHFENVNEAIQKLTKFLADSKLFLPTYDLRKSQERIDALNDSLAQTRTALIPKKKFGFKNKTKAKSDSPGNSSPRLGSNVATPKSVVTEASSIEVDEGDHVITDKNRESIAVTENVNQRVVGLFRLEDCDVLLRGAPSAIHVRNLKRCRVFAGPVSGSIFIDRCEDCVFVLACQQLRIHTTKDTSFYIHVTSKAIVEGNSMFPTNELD